MRLCGPRVPLLVRDRELSKGLVASLILLWANTGSGQFVDQNLLNSATNNTTEGDEPPGLVSSISVSSRLSGNDDPADAFGNNNGPVEPFTFIFADGLGAGTVNTLDFTTSIPITLMGLEFNGGGNGGAADPRRILALNVLVDLDNNGTFEMTLYSSSNFPDPGIQILPFSSPVTASRFRLEIQNEDNGSFGGPRVTEINALVPEPGTVALCAFGLGLVVWKSTRRRTNS